MSWSVGLLGSLDSGEGWVHLSPVLGFSSSMRGGTRFPMQGSQGHYPRECNEWGQISGGEVVFPRPVRGGTSLGRPYYFNS